MASRYARLTLILTVLVAALLGSAWRPNQIASADTHAATAQRLAAPPGTSESRRPASRIVSLVPALTEMLFVIGAGPSVVGVSNFDTFPPAITTLPRVGALLDPDTERILALRPDLVIVYASQTDIAHRFEQAGIRVFPYRHAGINDVPDTMRRLGATIGRMREADAAATRLQQRLDDIRRRVKSRPRPRTLLVFERTPQTLRDLYVSGGIGFLNDMLTTAGAINVFDDVKRESVQPSQETLLVRAPDVIVEIRARAIANADDARRDHAVWGALVSLPAVRQHRVYFLSGDQLVVPGPRVVDGVEMIARVLHPDAFQ
jgi:iron complex transport system substrate-binding protein